MLPLLAGLALGVGKSLLDRQKEASDRELAAATAKYSPWTGLTPQPVHHTDILGNLVSGGATGLLFGQNMDQAGGMLPGGGAEQTQLSSLPDLNEESQLASLPDLSYGSSHVKGKKGKGLASSGYAPYSLISGSGYGG